MMRWPSRSECPRSTRRFYAILLGWPALLAWLPRSRAAPQAAAAVACQAGAPAKVFYKRGRAPIVLVAASGSHEAGQPEQLTPFLATHPHALRAGCACQACPSSSYRRGTARRMRSQASALPFWPPCMLPSSRSLAGQHLRLGGAGPGLSIVLGLAPRHRGAVRVHVSLTPSSYNFVPAEQVHSHQRHLRRPYGGRSKRQATVLQ